MGLLRWMLGDDPIYKKLDEYEKWLYEESERQQQKQRQTNRESDEQRYERQLDEQLEQWKDYARKKNGWTK
jgi:hypothetical protein